MRFLPKWRLMTWIILGVNVVALFSIISAASSNCEGETGTNLEACQAGTGIGVGLLVFLLAAVDLILGVIWLITNRKKTRDCPACGADVKKGLFACKKCGYDFRSALSQQQPGWGAPPAG